MGGPRRAAGSAASGGPARLIAVNRGLSRLPLGDYGSATRDVWLDGDLAQPYSDPKGVVFLASAASVSSQWCFAEISLARSLDKPVFPLRLEAGVGISG